jgi:Uma2 family endonuclease
MLEIPERRMTLTEFLKWDDGTDTRYELVGGRVVPMPICGVAHGTILANLAYPIGGRLRAQLRAGIRGGIVPQHRDDTYYLADLVVSGGPPAPQAQSFANPVLIVEVLSPSTAQHDRGTKLVDYREIPSVQEILLVSSEVRRVEIWRREGTRWIVETLIGDAELRLAAVDEPLPLSAIYENAAA